MALTPKLTALFAAGVLAAFAAGAASAAGMPSKINGPHAKLPCSTCHKNEMTAPPKETCLSCHGSYDKLAERTAKLTPNPHFSHRGEEDCTNCHSLHGKSRLECNDCHSFNLNFKCNRHERTEFFPPLLPRRSCCGSGGRRTACSCGER